MGVLGVTWTYNLSLLVSKANRNSCVAARKRGSNPYFIVANPSDKINTTVL